MDFNSSEVLIEDDNSKGGSLHDRYSRSHPHFNPFRLSTVNQEERSCWNRVFRGWGYSSMKTAFFSLLCVSVGTGEMAMPKAMAWAGWAGGTIILLIGAFCNIYSYYLVVHCQSLVKKLK